MKPYINTVSTYKHELVADAASDDDLFSRTQVVATFVSREAADLALKAIYLPMWQEMHPNACDECGEEDDLIEGLCYWCHQYRTPSNKPEAFGCRRLGMLHNPTLGAYEFHQMLVLGHEDGRVFWATDSGCSCPTPFEGVRSLDDMHELRDLKEFSEVLATFPADAVSRVQLLAKVAEHVDTTPNISCI